MVYVDPNQSLHLKINAKSWNLDLVILDDNLDTRGKRLFICDHDKSIKNWPKPYSFLLLGCS